MLKATLYVTTPNLLIRRSLNELAQAAIYAHLPSCEHDGHQTPNGKKFKKSVFRADYDYNAIEIKFASIDKNYEEAVAKAILKDEFRIGAAHISNAHVGVEHRTIPQETTKMQIDGYACVHINDAMGKRLYLEPRDNRFTEIVAKNTAEKYEAFFGEALAAKPEIRTLWQSEKPVYICYKAARHKVFKARYEVKADAKTLNLILDTGLGSKIMQGCGWMGVIKNKAGGLNG